jgi:hypothetical protein
MPDSDDLKPFAPSSFPSIPGGETRYFVEQDRAIAQSIKTIIEVMKRLEARIEALEPP